MNANRSPAVMQQRHAGAFATGRDIAPEALDYFPTPPWATRAGCAFLRDALGQPLAGQSVWEPACGELHMARPLAEYFASVRATDVHRYGQDHGICDFLLALPSLWSPVDWVFTNPPFMLAEQFIAQAMLHARRGVVMLVRSAFTEGEGRFSSLFQHTPPSHVVTFCERVVILRGRLVRAGAPDPFSLDPATGEPRKASTATSYCLLVWHRPTGQDWLTDTRHRWIAPCRRQLERDGDYPAYPEQWAALHAARSGGAAQLALTDADIPY